MAKNQLRISLIPSGGLVGSGVGGSGKRGGSRHAAAAAAGGAGGTSSVGGSQQDTTAEDEAEARLTSPSAVQRLRVATSSAPAATSNSSSKSGFTPLTGGNTISIPALSPVASQVVAELLETLVVNHENANTDVAQEGVVPPAAPLLPRSAICRLLAELVASYPAVARLLVEHRYVGPPGPCSALSFIIDHLLPAQQLPSTTGTVQQQQNTANGTSTGTVNATTSVPGDKDAAALSRVLITTLAGCNQPPEVRNSRICFLFRVILVNSH